MTYYSSFNDNASTGGEPSAAELIVQLSDRIEGDLEKLKSGQTADVSYGKLQASVEAVHMVNAEQAKGYASRVVDALGQSKDMEDKWLVSQMKSMLPAQGAQPSEPGVL